MNQRAFTLIEVLAVIAIMSMSMTVGLVNLASGGEQTRLRTAAGALRDLDAQARIAARREGSMVITLESEHTLATLSVSRTGERLSQAAIPSDVNVLMMTVSGEVARPTDLIRFDARGRSADYTITLNATTEVSSGQVAPVHSFSVCGLTGWIVEDERGAR